jgi:uncharacterized membrane protein YphA (DoxX/SURF4 family)
MTLDDIRKTSDNKLAGSIRILLAVLFLMTGAMKLRMPMLAEAWSGQLLAANIPLIVIVIIAYVLCRGAGAWSMDLRATRAAA